jgi:menaquinone-dependent protoporphyrinogen oxidase
MNMLVAYGSKHGATKGIAERIAERLRAEGQQATAQPVGAVDDLSGYDAFVIGSAVYAGRWTQEATEFVRRHRAMLASRPVWLFSSGPIGTMATKHEPVEPNGVTAIRCALNPRDHRVFFGAWDRSKLDRTKLDRTKLDRTKLGFAERIVAKRLPEGDWRDWRAIDGWAVDIARGLRASQTATR